MRSLLRRTAQFIALTHRPREDRAASPAALAPLPSPASDAWDLHTTADSMGAVRYGHLKFSGAVALRDRERLEGSVRSQIEAGVAHWQVNLGVLECCDAVLLGFLMAIHSATRKAAGSLQVRLERDSQPHRALEAAKLDRILTLSFN